MQKKFVVLSLALLSLVACASQSGTGSTSSRTGSGSSQTASERLEERRREREERREAEGEVFTSASSVSSVAL